MPLYHITSFRDVSSHQTVLTTWSAERTSGAVEEVKKPVKVGTVLELIASGVCSSVTAAACIMHRALRHLLFRAELMAHLQFDTPHV